MDLIILLSLLSIGLLIKCIYLYLENTFLRVKERNAQDLIDGYKNVIDETVNLVKEIKRHRPEKTYDQIVREFEEDLDEIGLAVTIGDARDIEETEDWPEEL